MFRYRKMPVYQDSIAFHRFIVHITKAFPRDFEYLKNQVRRSSLSVALNIAEGSAKHSDKEFNRYIVISLGSINESMAACEIAVGEGLISKEDFEKAAKLAENLTKQLGGFSKSLKQ